MQCSTCVEHCKDNDSGGEAAAEKQDCESLGILLGVPEQATEGVFESGKHGDSSRHGSHPEWENSHGGKKRDGQTNLPVLKDCPGEQS